MRPWLASHRHRTPPLLVAILAIILPVFTALLPSEHSKLHLVCKEPDSQVCKAWPADNHVTFLLPSYQNAQITKRCGLSDLTPISPHRKYFKVKFRNAVGFGVIFCDIDKVSFKKIMASQSMNKTDEKIYRIPRAAAYAPRGRYRGQTQSQYLAINDGDKNEGKAEAHSDADSSRASVSGSSGMGQAQSQSMYDPGCDDCNGQSVIDAEKLKRKPFVSSESIPQTYTRPNSGTGLPGTNLGGQAGFSPGQVGIAPSQGGTPGSGIYRSQFTPDGILSGSVAPNPNLRGTPGGSMFPNEGSQGGSTGIYPNQIGTPGSNIKYNPNQGGPVMENAAIPNQGQIQDGKSSLYPTQGSNSNGNAALLPNNSANLGGPTSPNQSGAPSSNGGTNSSPGSTYLTPSGHQDGNVGLYPNQVGSPGETSTGISYPTQNDLNNRNPNIQTFPGGSSGKNYANSGGAVIDDRFPNQGISSFGTKVPGQAQSSNGNVVSYPSQGFYPNQGGIPSSSIYPISGGSPGTPDSSYPRYGVNVDGNPIKSMPNQGTNVGFLYDPGVPKDNLGHGAPIRNQQTNWPIRSGSYIGPDGLTYYCCVVGPNQQQQIGGIVPPGLSGQPHTGYGPQEYPDSHYGGTNLPGTPYGSSQKDGFNLKHPDGQYRPGQPTGLSPGSQYIPGSKDIAVGGSYGPGLQSGTKSQQPGGQFGTVYTPGIHPGQQRGTNFQPGAQTSTGTSTVGQYIPGQQGGARFQPSGQYPGQQGNANIQPGGQYGPGEQGSASFQPGGQYGPRQQGGTSFQPRTQFEPGQQEGTSFQPGGQYGPGQHGGTSFQPSGQYGPVQQGNANIQPVGQYGPGQQGGASFQPSGQYGPGQQGGTTQPGGQINPGSSPGGQYGSELQGNANFAPGGHYSPGQQGGTSNMPGGQYKPGQQVETTQQGVPINTGSPPGVMYGPGQQGTANFPPGGQYGPGKQGGTTQPGGQINTGSFPGAMYGPGQQGGANFSPGGQYGPGQQGGTTQPGGLINSGSTPGVLYGPGQQGTAYFPPGGQYGSGQQGGTLQPGGQINTGSSPGVLYGPGQQGGAYFPPGGQYGPGQQGGTTQPGGQINTGSSPGFLYGPGQQGGAYFPPGGQYDTGQQGGTTQPGVQINTGTSPGVLNGPGQQGGAYFPPGGQYGPGQQGGTTLPGGKINTGSSPGVLYGPGQQGGANVLPGGQDGPKLQGGANFKPDGQISTGTIPSGQYSPGQQGGSNIQPGGLINTGPYPTYGQGATQLPSGVGPQTSGTPDAGEINGINQYGTPQNVLDPNSIAATLNDYDSNAEASVAQNANGTIASASSRGGNDKGRAQTNVQGTYTGSGSFSAQAEISDENKAAHSEVEGGKKGAKSSAQGRGQHNLSQASVQLGSETGSLQTAAETKGSLHSSNSKVQGSVKGGMADAQAKGPGSTSSQAQIGFTPYKEGDTAHEKIKTPFIGKGTASAQSSGRSGQSQSSLGGTFKYGISYNGAAQSGASLDKDTVFPNRLPFNNIDVYDDNNKNININTEEPPNVMGSTDKNVIEENEKESFDNNSDSQHTHYDHHKLDDKSQVPGNGVSIGTRRSFQPNYTNEYEYSTGKDDTTADEYYPDGGFGPEGSDNTEVEPNEYSDESNKDSDTTHQSLQTQRSKGLEVEQNTGGNTQHIILGSLGNQDAEITQRNSERPDENRIYQPGEQVPGTGGYTIPIGFTGSVKSVSSKEKTYVVGSKDSPSQAQTVSLSPGSGKVRYVYPPAYGRNVKPKDLKSLYKSAPDDGNRYMSVSKSVTRDLDEENNIRKQYSHTYYTKSSSCGYFTFTCTMVSGANGQKKVCKPKIPTNPDGTPMKC